MVLGAQKAGTTWLEKNLGAHPEVFTPVHKELHFFDKSEVYARGLDWYEKQFLGKSPGQSAGEFTPNYFWLPDSPEEAKEGGQMPDIPQRVRQSYPDAKFIIILRDPVARAVSAYYHHIRARRISPGERLTEVVNHYGIRSMGHYAKSLRAWWSEFPKEQFHYMIYEEDVLSDPLSGLQSVSRFLGIDQTFRPRDMDSRFNQRDSHLLIRLNQIFPPAARVLRRISPNLGSRWKCFEIKVEEEELVSLREHYREEINELEHMLERRLPWK